MVNTDGTDEMGEGNGQVGGDVFNRSEIEVRQERGESYRGDGGVIWEVDKTCWGGWAWGGSFGLEKRRFYG